MSCLLPFYKRLNKIRITKLYNKIDVIFVAKGLYEIEKNQQEPRVIKIIIANRQRNVKRMFLWK